MKQLDIIVAIQTNIKYQYKKKVIQLRVLNNETRYRHQIIIY